MLEPTSDPAQAPGCDGSVGPVLPRELAEERAGLLKVLAHPVRLQLLSLVAGAPDRQACVCDLTDAVPVAQPTVSHHLKVLVDAGLLTRRRRGTWSWFAVADDAPATLASLLPAPWLPGSP